mmetsp:Transcript_25769/g.59881  ORF Transcript_25769/g.59881 Transcript_25769/m.59881 type:complete len:314 (+) Transcript_25769:726-1667(+)
MFWKSLDRRLNSVLLGLRNPAKTSKPETPPDLEEVRSMSMFWKSFDRRLNSVLLGSLPGIFLPTRFSIPVMTVVPDVSWMPDVMLLRDDFKPNSSDLRPNSSDLKAEMSSARLAKSIDRSSSLLPTVPLCRGSKLIVLNSSERSPSFFVKEDECEVFFMGRCLVKELLRALTFISFSNERDTSFFNCAKSVSSSKTLLSKEAIEKSPDSPAHPRCAAVPSLMMENSVDSGSNGFLSKARAASSNIFLEYLRVKDPGPMFGAGVAPWAGWVLVPGTMASWWRRGVGPDAPGLVSSLAGASPDIGSTGEVPGGRF